MSEHSVESIEARGATVEVAIDAGLASLGLAREAVDVTVIDEGSRGILGIGVREAIVRLAPKAATAADVEQVEPEPPKPATPEPPAPEPAPAQASPSVVSDEVSSDLEEERVAAEALVVELLDKMHLDASVSSGFSDPDDMSGHRVPMIDIAGDDLGILIGPRGGTLEALQFVTRLMVAHQLHRRANHVIDVEGYREKRQQALARLAERMADKTRQRQQPVTLEPMSPYERRIIHMALRDAPDVYTESTGEGDRRRVRIYPR